MFIGRNLFKDLPPIVIEQMNEPNATSYCLDFSKFDTCVLPIHIDWFFDFLNRVVIHDHRSQQVIDSVRTMLKCVPILAPTGNLYTLTSGLASGSYFTQLIGSYVNPFLYLK